jgi:hypothetical protein
MSGWMDVDIIMYCILYKDFWGIVCIAAEAENNCSLQQLNE